MAENPIPKTIGAILDGNRRWAAANGVPKLEGHRAGYHRLKEFARWAYAAGVETVLVYAFSTENWQREESEVSYLMQLLRWVLESEINEFHRDGIRVRFIGDHSRFSKELQQLMTKAEAKTQNNTKGTMCVLVSYGGRAEIVAAAKKIIQEGVAVDALDEDAFAAHLWTAGIRDPDLIIRTGGVSRLSNFLPWQGAYSELFFSETLWPDFTKEEFLAILAEYAKRERRFGK
ncbi:MAG: di-trans,poly-cis-decaprenylcistransferase [Candidatus Sungbacteria bacterium RIFCSPHIGHO2_02_FULL_49_12]|uniref:Isoprenyl transferase n=1 Tax=Candidatus Sungbacteria bacterium RIFCSPHIGHO2_02_FULL_49_12 TaxID=1802271 RepID=A0A1G2KLX7_9BACT|nr:MAG: di-trans,poly-cis-decaprenylcistransferase [Candidatus Sungbacteria bacterium RIFCSPHIGHO2_02_FULL_49_12]